MIFSKRGKGIAVALEYRGQRAELYGRATTSACPHSAGLMDEMDVGWGMVINDKCAYPVTIYSN